MCKRILCLLLCIVMALSFSMVSYADIINDMKAFETVGEIVCFGHYEQDNDLSNGKEPIEWVVLDVQDGKSLLMSKYLIDAQPYNIGNNSNIWKDCSLREWLNTSFYLTAFSDDQKRYIIETEVDNSSSQDYSWWSEGGSDNTKDRVFVLSYTESELYKDLIILNEHQTTEYTRNIGKSRDMHFYGDKINAGWWRRSPGPTQGLGMVWYSSFNMFDLSNERPIHQLLSDYFGVRPILWIDLNELQTHPDILESAGKNVVDRSLGESTVPEQQLEERAWDKEIELTTVGDTTWKMWLPDGFVADELTEADLADHYIGYYLRDDDIIAVQYSDNSASLTDWQKELSDLGFSIEGLYNINGSEAVLYRDEDTDTITASVLDGRGKLLEVTFYPYSAISEEADTVISSIQQEASKKRLSGASGNNKTGAGTGETVSSPSTSPEEAYQEMVTAYKAGNYSDSYSYYEQAKGYQDADKYGNLLKARLCYTLKLTDSEIEELEKAIVNDISFADSKDVLVCNSAIAHYYLLGTWYSTNGTYIYEVKDNGGTTTTVPVVPRTGNYYEILNGTYWRYFDDKWDERTAVFDFKPISKSKMEIYSYQVKQSYTFNKTR